MVQRKNKSLASVGSTGPLPGSLGIECKIGPKGIARVIGYSTNNPLIVYTM